MSGRSFAFIDSIYFFLIFVLPKKIPILLEYCFFISGKNILSAFIKGLIIHVVLVILIGIYAIFMNVHKVFSAL
ncbi:hypothetical protein ACJX0J_021132, partial [Zea mays]